MNIIYFPNSQKAIQQEIKEACEQKRAAFEASVDELKYFINEKLNAPKTSEADVGTFEKSIWLLLMTIGLRAVEWYLAHIREAPASRRILGSDNRIYKYIKEKVYSLRSIFGEGSYMASQYQRGERADTKRELCHFECEVGLLPSGGLSPILALEICQLCTLMAYQQAQEVLRHFRQYVPSTRSMCGIIDLIGSQSEVVLDQVDLKGGEVAVVQVDARSAPTIREEEYEKRCQPHKKRCQRESVQKGKRRMIRVKGHPNEKPRRTRGKKAKKNKQVTVGLIYALDRLPDGSWEGAYGKFLARFGSAEAVFKRLKQTLDAMGDVVKQVVFISDGAPQYRKLQLKYFPNAMAVVDFYHVSEYLWKAGEALYAEGSEELWGFVSLLKEMLSRSEIHEVLSILRGELERIPLKGPGTKGRRQRMTNAINYISKRIHQMPYRELRELGLEIGSGAIEGAVRQIVAIRFDGPGMRWGDHRPQLLLHMICLRLSGAWDKFSEAIVNWAHTLHERQRMTPVGVNERIIKPDDAENNESSKVDLVQIACNVKKAA